MESSSHTEPFEFKIIYDKSHTQRSCLISLHVTKCVKCYLTWKLSRDAEPWFLLEIDHKGTLSLPSTEILDRKQMFGMNYI